MNCWINVQETGLLLLNAFTIDLEDWYQGLEIDRCHWEKYEHRIEIGTHRLLTLLDEAEVQATFFVLGYAAERSASLIREIASRGHEIATHGYSHQFVYNQTPQSFRDDVKRSIDLLEPLSEMPIIGHRAPYFSITPKSAWALEVLRECGIEYDSSVFPVTNYRYGFPGARRDIHEICPGLVELPLSTYRICRINIPIAGGAYLRLFPYTFIRCGLQRINESGQAAIFYIHPWELDPGHPRLNLAGRIKLTHYCNLRKTATKLRKLLQDFCFGTVSQVLSSANFGPLTKS